MELRPFLRLDPRSRAFHADWEWAAVDTVAIRCAQHDLSAQRDQRKVRYYTGKKTHRVRSSAN